jgi:hypothetical protein
MKQRFTLLLSVAALFSFQISSAQNLLSESFDTSNATNFYTVTSYHGWTDTLYSYGSCCPSPGTSYNYNWFIGPQPGSYTTGFPSYTSYASAYSYFGPSPATHSGNGYVFLNTFYLLYGGYIYTKTKSELVSPAVTLPSSGQSVVSYWVFLNSGYYGVYGGYYWDSLQVWVNTGPRSYGSNVYKLRKLTVDSLSSSSYNGWVQFADTIPSSFNGQTVNIMFTGYNQYYYYGSDIYLDDISVDHYFDCSVSPGGPHCGTPKGPSHVCRTKVFNLVDTGATKYVNYSFQWQSRPTGTTTWTNIIGATSNPLVTSIPLTSDNTDYRVYMTCNSSGFTDTSSSWTVLADSFFRCYCAMPTTGTTIGGNTPPVVDSVSISNTNLHFPSHTGFSNGYGQIADSVIQTKAVMSRGGTYTLNVWYGGSTAYGMAWADWNRSGAFNDTSSEYLLLNSSLKSNASITFTVPVTARLGRTGLRVRTSKAYSASSGYSCTNFGTGTGAGETVDYIIQVVDTPAIDAGVTGITSPPYGKTYCATKVDSVYANIYNYGGRGLSNFYVYAVIAGPHPDTIYTVYTNILPPLTSANIYIGTIAPPLGGNYLLKVFTKAVGDSVNINDTGYSIFNIYNFPSNATIHSDTVCPGGTAHISVDKIPGTIYNWYRVPTGGTRFSTSLSMTVVPTGDSIYYVSATDSITGCISNRVAITASERPAPIVNLGPDTTLCESPAFLLDAGNPGAKYMWNTGDTVRMINPKVTGEYIVAVNHYCVVEDSVSVTLNPLPSASGIDYVRTGNTYAYFVGGPLYVDHYKWYFGDGITDTNANPIHTYATGGTYTVKVILYNNCGTDTVGLGVPNKVININGSGSRLTIYPNPANNQLTVSADNTEIKQVLIFNTVGRMVYQTDAKNSKTLNIDISQLPEGQYILKAATGTGYNNQVFDILRR